MKLIVKNKTRILFFFQAIFITLLFLLMCVNITIVFMAGLIEKKEFLKKIFQHSKIILPITFLSFFLAFLIIGVFNKIIINKEMQKISSKVDNTDVSSKIDNIGGKKVSHESTLRAIILIFSITMIASLGILTLIGFIPIDDNNFEKIAIFLRQNEKILSILYVALEGLVIASFLFKGKCNWFNFYFPHYNLTILNSSIIIATLVFCVRTFELYTL